MRLLVKLKERVGRLAAGDIVRLPSIEARTLVAIGKAEYVAEAEVGPATGETPALQAESSSSRAAPKPERGSYKRRDMRAEETRAPASTRVERTGKSLPVVETASPADPAPPSAETTAAADGASASADSASAPANNDVRVDEANDAAKTDDGQTTIA